MRMHMAAAAASGLECAEEVVSSDAPFQVVIQRVKFQLCSWGSRDPGACATCPCHKRSEIYPARRRICGIHTGLSPRCVCGGGSAEAEAELGGTVVP